MSDLQSPLRVRLRNDYEVVVAGLRSILAPYSDRIDVVATKVGEDGGEPVAVTLYDTFGLSQADGEEIDDVLRDPTSGKVVVYSWNMQEELVGAALSKGCRGYLDKSVGASVLVSGLEAIAAGEIVVSGTDDRSYAPAHVPGDVAGDWPGKDAGLSAREAEVVALITRGFTNEEITRHTYITINTLKSCIRSAYRKMGVERRSQAVRWGMEHGAGCSLPPDPDRSPSPRTRPASSRRVSPR